MPEQTPAALPADDSDIRHMTFEDARLLSAAEDKVEKIKLSRAGQPTGVEPLDPA